eukprot:m.125536 g.125536  ORF g.125536 m.125536 type:complete len:294 (-) comp19785_c0_seq4:125-1006(-)
MWDPVRVNFTRQVDLDGTVYTMRTMALHPPVFEVENFIKEEEIEAIKELALQSGLFQSDFTYLDGSNLDDRGKVKLGLSEEEAEKLFRYSEQTWLEPRHDLRLRALLQRVQNLALFPDHFLSMSEQMQVVRYLDHGHYESHHDSERDHTGPCCADPVARGMTTGADALTRPLDQRCRLCRVITVLFYLEDTEEGGGTIFPLADTTEEQYMEWAAHKVYKQTQACSPGLSVPPKKGKAIMWYNHEIEDGYLGPLIERSLHGGCNVKRGRKWVANNWLTAIPHPDKPRLPARAHF